MIQVFKPHRCCGRTAACATTGRREEGGDFDDDDDDDDDAGGGGDDDDDDGDDDEDDDHRTHSRFCCKDYQAVPSSSKQFQGADFDLVQSCLLAEAIICARRTLARTPDGNVSSTSRSKH